MFDDLMYYIDQLLENKQITENQWFEIYDIIAKIIKGANKIWKTK